MPGTWSLETSIVQYSTMQYNIVQCSTCQGHGPWRPALYSTVQCSTIEYSVVHPRAMVLEDQNCEVIYPQDCNVMSGHIGEQDHGVICGELFCVQQLYCTVLYCTVLYCTVLYYIVLHCTVLYCIVLHCTVLYCTALYCIVLHCTVLY